MKTMTRLLNCTLILALGCFVQFANAQIVYTDVNPNDTITCSGACTNSYNLDLDNNGSIDFTIVYNHPFLNYFVTITSNDSNQVAASNYPLALNLNDSINQNLSFTSTISTLRAYVQAHGGFWGYLGYFAGDHYIGLRLKDGTNYYYGWARVYVILNQSVHFCVIEEYAYNSIANQFILAGQTCPAPSLLISVSGDLTFCKGSSVTLTADNSAAQFQWNKNTTAIIGATNYSYEANESGAYTCNLTNSCGTITSDSSVVTVNKKPKATITPSGIVSMCAGSITTLSANSGNNLSYQWKKNGSNISGETNSTLAATQAGDYKVKVTNANTGCSKTSKATTVNITCKAGEVLNDEKLSVSPNPFSQSTVISFQLVKDENVSLKIFDVEGRLIRTLAQGTMSKGTHELTWDARDENGSMVHAGIYFLKIQSTDFSQTEKLIVTK